jgi:hypothetical protein
VGEERLGDRPEGEGPPALDGSPGQHVRMATTSFRGGLPEQARLADSGLACDHQRATVAVGHAIETVADFTELLVASDHDRAQKPRHGSEHATAAGGEGCPERLLGAGYADGALRTEQQATTSSHSEGPATTAITRPKALDIAR